MAPDDLEDRPPSPMFVIVILLVIVNRNSKADITDHIDLKP
jgi:hypothetical protein